jgi:hypothetical protein
VGEAEAWYYLKTPKLENAKKKFANTWNTIISVFLKNLKSLASMLKGVC